MRIIVAGGRNKADFLIGSLLEKRHDVTMIHDEKEYGQYLCEKYHIPVIIGNPGKPYILEEANVEGADILIALRPSDADNLAICQMAKKLFHVQKVVATVSNPKNVSIFKRLGVNTAISATYTIAKIIEQASTLEHLVHSLSIEQDEIVMSEIRLSDKSSFLKRQVKDLQLPDNVIICCILRGSAMIVPNGDTLLKEQDKLVFLSHADVQETLLKQFYSGC